MGKETGSYWNVFFSFYFLFIFFVLDLHTHEESTALFMEINIQGNAFVFLNVWSDVPYDIDLYKAAMHKAM